MTGGILRMSSLKDTRHSMLFFKRKIWALKGPNFVVLLCNLQIICIMCANDNPLAAKCMQVCSQGFRTEAYSFRQFKASVSLLLAGSTPP